MKWKMVSNKNSNAIDNIEDKTFIQSSEEKDSSLEYIIEKILQKLGSWTVRLASGTDIPDAPSGFRAISKQAAKKLNVFSRYTYTLETIIQAGKKGIAITWVPVETNEAIRPSRLLRSIPSYVTRSITTIIRIFIVYRPFRFFATIGALLISAGSLLLFRFLYFYFFESGSGHIQSLIISSILIGIGFHTFLIAFIADLISVNRRLLEKINMSLYEKKQPKKEPSTKSD